MAGRVPVVSILKIQVKSGRDTKAGTIFVLGYVNGTEVDHMGLHLH